jgi:RHS repeat-associated protein
VAYTYDALGQRIAKQVSGVVTRFVWRGGHVVYETDGAGTITDHTDGDRRYYVVQDALRSVRGLVRREANGSLTWVAAYRYSAYGQVLSAEGEYPFPLRFRWGGAMLDAEAGLYFLRTRHYDPRFGRFLQEDAIGFSGGGNLYAYAAGRPTDRLLRPWRGQNRVCPWPPTFSNGS